MLDHATEEITLLFTNSFMKKEMFLMILVYNMKLAHLKVLKEVVKEEIFLALTSILVELVTLLNLMEDSVLKLTNIPMQLLLNTDK